jgi:hypothetical protein
MISVNGGKIKKKLKTITAQQSFYAKQFGLKMHIETLTGKTQK